MLGARIKEYLQENGIKQSFVADKTGFGISKINRICNSDATITILDYCKICKVLGVPLEYFLKDLV